LKTLRSNTTEDTLKPQERISEATLRDCLAKARTILLEARPLITEAVEKDFEFRRKEDQSWVTEIDLAVERRLRSRIQEEFPQHGIIGEEFSDQNKTAEFTWVVDPIDGTSSLRHRVPLFGTILALLHDDKPVLGLIDLPMLGRLYSGGAGLGVQRNDQAVRITDVSGDSEVPSEIISLGGRGQYVSAGVPHVFDDLFRMHPQARTYGDCFGHGMVLEGAVGAMVDFDLRIWDKAATEVLVKEAGGTFVCVRQREGKDQSFAEARYDVIFGKPRVVDWIVDRLQLA
jgi:fructose-1,6-bisphosphatase/inositol monophosphatase family enzyme